MTGTVTFTRGIPGSGKTTAAESWLSLPGDRLRLSRDDMRDAMYGKFWGLTYAQERFITKTQVDITRRAVRAGIDVLIDATNLNNSLLRRDWLKHGFDVRFWDFPIELDEALARNAARDRVVPENVIRKMFQRGTVDRKGTLIPPPDITEPVVWTRYEPNGDSVHAIVVDVDGTLARMVTDRNPYDGSRAHEDAAIEHMADVVRSYDRHHPENNIVILSGRSEAHRGVTEKWLYDNRIPYDELHMRANGDNRRDDIVKHELFHNHISWKYNVEAVYDDRLQVCRMWHAIGVPLFRLGIPDQDDF